MSQSLIPSEPFAVLLPSTCGGIAYISSWWTRHLQEPQRLVANPLSWEQVRDIRSSSRFQQM